MILFLPIFKELKKLNKKKMKKIQMKQITAVNFKNHQYKLIKFMNYHFKMTILHILTKLIKQIIN